MHSKRIGIISVAFLVVGLGCLSLLSGCGGDSKTSGSRLEMSPEVKAQMKDMGAAQKELREERKQQRIAGKKKGK